MMQSLTIIAAGVLMLVTLVMIVIILSRYVKAGPNQLLVVSGRKHRLPDGTVLGCRIVKGGGTFVMPIFEQAAVLSLEAVTIEMPRTKARVAGGNGVEVDCTAQVKINSDDASIVPAMELFLGKQPAEIKAIARPVLGKHLTEVLGRASLQSVTENPMATATAMQTAAAEDLARMGSSIISVTLRNTRPA